MISFSVPTKLVEGGVAVIGVSSGDGSKVGVRLGEGLGVVVGSATAGVGGDDKFVLLG
jgi:hypothetical protein